MKESAEGRVVVGMAGQQIGLDEGEVGKRALLDIVNSENGTKLSWKCSFRRGVWMAPVTEIGQGSST